MKIDKPDNISKLVKTYGGVSKSTYYYRKNKDSKDKKDAYNKKYHSTEERKEYRRVLAKERRKRGIMGEGGKDVSHKKDGTFVLENKRVNRARNRGKK